MSLLQALFLTLFRVVTLAAILPHSPLIRTSISIHHTILTCLVTMSSLHTARIFDASSSSPIPLPLPIEKEPLSIIICPGFLLPKTCYENWQKVLKKSFPFSAVHFFETADQEDSKSSVGYKSIDVSAERLVRQLTNESNDHDEGIIILLGHSRGGAVALLAAERLKRRIERRICLLLLDPVDDEALTATSFSSSSSLSLSNVFDKEKGEEEGIGTLILSTPYGGKSRYYSSATFTSSCAPIGRNADAFYHAILQRKSLFEPPTLITFPRLGHLQLLSREGLKGQVFENSCPSSQPTEADTALYLNFAYLLVTSFAQDFYDGKAEKKKRFDDILHDGAPISLEFRVLP